MCAWSGVFVPFSPVVPKYLRRRNLKKERIILSHSLRGYSSPWWERHSVRRLHGGVGVTAASYMAQTWKHGIWWKQSSSITFEAWSTALNFIQLDLASWRFHSLPKQSHHPDTKSSNTCAGEEHFTIKPKQQVGERVYVMSSFGLTNWVRRCLSGCTQ